MTTKRLRRNGWTLLGTVESDTQPDTEYEIKRSPDGRTGCACMGWAFNGECKHVRRWLEGVALPSFQAVGVATFVRPAEPTKKQPVPVKPTETFTIRRAFAFGGI